MPSWTGNSCGSDVRSAALRLPVRAPGRRGSPKYFCMRITFLGHAGLFVETRHGSVLCDPWFTPGLFRVVVPVSPQRPASIPAAFGRPDFLYVSHLHRDHFDPEFLARHVDKGTRVLLPDFPTPFLERALRDLGFTPVRRARAHGEPIDLDGLEVTIFAMTDPADGPLGDSALVLGDGTTRAAEPERRPARRSRRRCRRSARTTRTSCSSPGAIWYPIVYDFPAEERTRLARDKRVEPDGARRGSTSSG